MSTTLRFITDFADQGVVLPMALVLALSLAAERWWRAAIGWSIAAAGVLGLMLTVKVAFAAFGGFDGIDGDALRSPSGHTAAAALLAGGLAAVIAPDTRHRIRVPLLAGLLAAVAIGMTRVALGDHSVADVVAATPVGIGGAFLAVRLMGPPPAGMRLWRVLPPALAVGVLMHGTHLRFEPTIQEWGADAARLCFFVMNSSINE